MADGKIRVSFEPKGDKELIDAIKSLNRETKKLRGINVLTEKSVDKVTKAKGRQRRNSDALDKSLFGLGGTLSVLRSKFLLYAFAIQQATVFIGNHIRRMSDLNAMEDSFNNLAVASELNADTLERLQDATDGTVNKMDLLKQANNALLLGVFKSTEQMEEAFDAAQRLGKALGQNTTMSIESLVTGLGRQSKLMLDNLGIVFSVEKAYKRYAFEIGKAVEELSDQEKKTAFVNTALREMNRLVSDLPEEVLNWSDAMKILSVETFDFATDTAPKSISALIEWLRIIENKLPNALKRGSSQMHETFEAVKKGQSEPIIILTENILKMNKSYKGLKEKYTQIIESSDILSTGMQVQNESVRGGIELIIALQNALKETALAEGALMGKTTEFIPAFEKQKLQVREVNEEIIHQISLIEQLGARFHENSKTSSMWARALSDAASINQDKSKENALFAKRAAQLEAIVNTAAQVTKFLHIPPLAASIAALGAVQVAKIEAQKFETGGMVGGRRHSQGGTMIEAERGEFVMSRNAVSAIGVENLNRMNQGQSGGGGSTIVINNPIVNSDFVENDFAELMREAVRRGADFGSS